MVYSAVQSHHPIQLSGPGPTHTKKNNNNNKIGATNLHTAAFVCKDAVIKVPLLSSRNPQEPTRGIPNPRPLHHKAFTKNYCSLIA